MAFDNLEGAIVSPADKMFQYAFWLNGFAVLSMTGVAALYLAADTTVSNRRWRYWPLVDFVTGLAFLAAPVAWELSTHGWHYTWLTVHHYYGTIVIGWLMDVHIAVTLLSPLMVIWASFRLKQRYPLRRGRRVEAAGV